MKHILGFAVGFALVMGTAPALAAWPYDEVLQYECGQALKERATLGFGCKMDGRTLTFAIDNFFPDDEEKKAYALYRRNVLMVRYLSFGGSFVTFYDFKSSPKKRKTCTRGNNSAALFCENWADITPGEIR